MERTVRIVQAPNNPGLEVVGDMAMKVVTPFSKDAVTIMFSPDVRHYTESADKTGMQVRQVFVMQHTDDTIKKTFDFAKHSCQTVSVSGVKYQVTLLRVDHERFDNLDFPVYEFLVVWDGHP